MKNEFLISILGTFAVAAVVMFGVNLFAGYMCAEKSKVMGKPHTYGFVQGYMIAGKDGYVPIEQYRVLE